MRRLIRVTLYVCVSIWQYICVCVCVALRSRVYRAHTQDEERCQLLAPARGAQDIVSSAQ